ncbi:hypothetical protein GLOIN_2v1883854 [Rhizophagus clarus]|uniref:Uncharacterized protein n=1 Tax=Rhizophagus clarus TaxID=94130 RepID=A0A8H3L375_9GLOM|nr:hypothetical protein GLOIN_2v1883854 [Rhizophagus clarus]
MCVENEFLVSSTNNIGLLYVVNSEIRVCSCHVGMSSASCYIVKEKSFYVSLHAQPQQSHAEMGTNNALITNNTYINEGSKESSEKDEEIDMSKVVSFLEVVKLDY